MAGLQEQASKSLSKPLLFSPGNPEKRDGRELSHDGKGDHGSEVQIVKTAQEPAAQKEEDSEEKFKEAIACGPVCLGNHGGYGRFQDGLLSAHAHAPQGDAQQEGRNGMQGKDQEGKRRGNER